MTEAEEAEEAAQALLDRGFHLGGSRRMAQKYPSQVVINDDTDWDFYCDNTIEKRVLLAGLGFKELECENRNYWDDLLVDIYKHPKLPFEVLIRKDVDVYAQQYARRGTGEDATYWQKLVDSTDRSTWMKR